MDEKAKVRRRDIDCLKGIAILAVVLYHMGLLESGYLGVDVFFVIAGFLTVPSVSRKIWDKQFSYIKFIWNRVIRLLPAVLIASVVCLIVGYFFWLPDDYENLAESIIASTAFSNNILSGITTKNYWNAVNDYKPLMHTWYLGILMEFYLVLPLITIFLNQIAKMIKQDVKKVTCVGYSILTVLSLAAFLMPGVSVGDRFYFLPFRFYELMLGGLIGINMEKFEDMTRKMHRQISCISFICIIFLICIGLFTFDISSIGVETVVIGQEMQDSGLLLPNVVLVILVTIFTAIFLAVSKNNKLFNNIRILPSIGQMSYSIFIWHQVILALYRYSISSKLSIGFVMAYIVLLCVVSELSYRFIELRINTNKKNSVITVAFACFICGFSAILYLRAGVVRDVPELGIYADNIHRNMHAEYCDRIYDYDVDYATTDKTKVLIVGNSYARDFGNIILESEYADDIELSYASSFDESMVTRIAEADRIFVFSSKKEIPDYLWANAKSESSVYGIGTKSFGVLNGQIYFKRFRDDYFEQTIEISSGYRKVNDSLKEEWGDHYIDMIEGVSHNNRIRIFTDTNMFISQDTKHLTKAGAQYYSKILDLNGLLY